jgi:serine/threonine-protein kinase
MSVDDSALTIAARIADGTDVDWPPAAGDANQTLVDELKAIAAVATLHRTPALTDDRAGERTSWGPLTLVRKIGEGGFGQVFEAWDARLERRLALKLLRQSSAPSARGSRAIEEARLLAKVRHPNVLTVYGAERVDGIVGIWTEFIEGHTLQELMSAHGSMPAADVVGIGIDVCRALTAVHEAGLLHRDVKAQNVMRETGGRIVLMDFGTGHDLGALPALAGDVSGTPLYLAPEIFDGGRATTASDVYAVGVLLFYLVTGHYPVSGRTLDDVRASHRTGRVSRLRDIRPQVSAGLAAAIERALSSDPSRRPRGAAELAAELLAAQRSMSPRRRVRWAAGIGTAATLAAALFYWPSAAGVSNDADAMSLHPLQAVGDVPLSTWTGPPSADGRFVPYSGLDGNVWIWEPAAGTTRRITERDPDLGEGAFDHVAISREADRVAYMWLNREQKYELRVTDVRAGGAGANVVLDASDEIVYPVPVEWSSDATSIVCLLFRQSGAVDLGLVPVQGGPPQVLATSRTGTPTRVSLSPDQRWLVYDAPAGEQDPQRELYIVGVDGSPPRLLASHPAHDVAPLWTPDGAGVFFISDRSAVEEGWLVRLRDGLAEGEPVVVARNMRGAAPIGFTSDGDLYFRLDTTALDVYTTPIDLARGLFGPAARVSATVVGGHAGPNWSPDGRLLAYIRRHPALAGFLTPLHRGQNTLIIQDVASGRSREVTPRLSDLQIAPPRWAPDGRSLLVKGTDLHSESGIFRVTVETGEASLAVPIGISSASAFGAFEFSADGRSVIYRHIPRGIVARDLATARETVLFDRREASIANFANFGLSSSGALALAGITRAADGKPAEGVVLVKMDDSVRQLVRLPVTERATFQDWTSDGAAVLFTRYTVEDLQRGDPHALWIAPLHGGPPRDTGIRVPSFTHKYHLAFSPDGRRLAFSSGETSAETWVIENFLPPGNSSRQHFRE